jgi:ABC-2 type transport system ATP-binding protein
MEGNEKQLKEQIGVVLADGQFHDCLTLGGIRSILKNIYANWDDDLFRKLCKQFSLPDKKTYKEFSTGTKRKTAIVAALSHHPRLLILDEPTSGLDPVVREEMLDLFLDFMQKDDHAMLLSSHITGDLDKIADSITFLHQGQVIFSRSREDLTEKMGLLKCGTAAFEALDKSHILRIRKSAFDVEALVDDRPYYGGRYPEMLLQPATTEEIMLFYVRGEKL